MAKALCKAAKAQRALGPPPPSILQVQELFFSDSILKLMALLCSSLDLKPLSFRAVSVACHSVQYKNSAGAVSLKL